MKQSVNRIEVVVALRPYLAKYIQGQLAQHDGLLHVDAKSALGAFLFSMLEKGLPPRRPEPEYSISIMLPVRDELGGLYDARSEGVFINDVNAVRINQFFDFIFKKELFSRLEVVLERGEMKRKSGRMKLEMLNYLEKYNIDYSHISYDTLAKSFYRYRKSGKLLIEQVI
jgi:hypothetical protein